MEFDRAQINDFVLSEILTDQNLVTSGAFQYHTNYTGALQFPRKKQVTPERSSTLLYKTILPLLHNVHKKSKDWKERKDEPELETTLRIMII